MLWRASRDRRGGDRGRSARRVELAQEGVAVGPAAGNAASVVECDLAVASGKAYAGGDAREVYGVAAVHADELRLIQAVKL